MSFCCKGPGRLLRVALWIALVICMAGQASCSLCLLARHLLHRCCPEPLLALWPFCCLVHGLGHHKSSSCGTGLACSPMLPCELLLSFAWLAVPAVPCACWQGTCCIVAALFRLPGTCCCCMRRLGMVGCFLILRVSSGPFLHLRFFISHVGRSLPHGVLVCNSQYSQGL